MWTEVIKDQVPDKVVAFLKSH